MKLIKIATAALNQTPLDWTNNIANIRNAIQSAKATDASLLCLPELCITGYGCEDAFFSSAVIQTAAQLLKELLPETMGMLVTVGLPVMHAGALFNTTAVLVDGKIAGLVPKQHLAGDGLHYEPRWFKPWQDDVVTTIDIAGVTSPIGDLLFEFDGTRLGFEICEDAWVANRPGVDHAKMAADIIFNPSASHFAFGKSVTRKRLVEEASRALGVTYVYSNLMGNEAGRIIYDGQTLIASLGEMIACGSHLNFHSVKLTDAVIDTDATRTQRIQSASFEPQLDVDAERIVELDFIPKKAKPAKNIMTVETWENSEHLKEEEFTRAIALALFDYLRKSHSSGFVVSLSGGADSAAVVCLVAMMVRLAIADIGVDKFCLQVGLKPFKTESHNLINDITQTLLTTVYQATRNSSDKTKNSAATIAKAVSAQHYELDVDDICQSYTNKIEVILDRKLQWESDDIALQNIQARSRGPAVWMLTNLNNALLLATSNRSEAAVGYATMDGDTCGGISPIAGIDKAFLRHWLRWMESDAPVGVEPIAELECVNKLQPTAELRPHDADQTDEDDLMPYDLLDAIEDHAIGKKRSPAEVLAMVVVEFPQYEHPQLTTWVRRFFQLWSRNQWKRERYAPSFHVDDKNLDPKTWCRFPILSGGFQRELDELG